MRWLKSYFVEPWPQPDGDAWGERFAYVYVVPGMVMVAAAAAAEKFAAMAVALLGAAIALAIHAMLKTRHWR